MKSVLIIHSDIYERYQKYAYFFNWFEDHSDVEVLIWNKYASEDADINELVPQLFDTVKNVSEWNAYIIDEPFVSGAFIEKDFQNLTQYAINPYERANSDAAYDPACDPLMRLTYFLGGRGVEDLEYINHFHFRAARPTQIFLLTPRIFENLEMQKSFLRAEIEERNRRLIADAQAVLTESNAVSIQRSDFWSRYQYPSNCRFLVFDMPDAANVCYENAWFLLWIAVMTVVLNSYNSAEIGAYKLYRLAADISSENFEAFLNKFYSALRNACDISEKEIEDLIIAAKAAMADTTSHHPVDCAPVYVDFPDTEVSSFFPKNSAFGITKDMPKLDTTVWSEHKKQSAAETHRLFKAVTRGKNEAVDAMNATFSVDLPLLRNQHLSRYDVEDIVETLNRSEIEMLELQTDGMVSRTAFEERERKAAEKIERALPARVMTKTYIMLLVMGVSVCLMGFIPFIISSAKFNFTSCLIAVLISLGTGAVVGAASFLALLLRRRHFDTHLKEYADTVCKNLETVQKNADIQSRYLSLLLNFMEKYQMMISGKRDERHLKQLEMHMQIRAAYEDALAQCQSIAGLCNVTLKEIDLQAGDARIPLLPGQKIYLYDDTDSLQIPLNTIPDRLTPPFSFVEALHITEEILYESSLYYGVCGGADGMTDDPETVKGAAE